MNLRNFSILLSFSVIFISCGKDDNFFPVSIETNPDIVSVDQNSEVQIDIFENDPRLPTSMTLNISQPNKGNAIIISSDNTISYASVLYTPFPNTIGEDSFQYTICDDNDPENCVTETVTITISSLSVVAFDPNEFPLSALSNYNFFEGDLKELNPTFGVIPYDLISPLFSDYAKKERFVWMPNGVKATYVNDFSTLDFPLGTILIKNFYYNNVLPNYEKILIETRLMYKTTNGWDFANYIWNTEQTEAFFDNQGAFVDINWLENGVSKSVNYRIPSRAECFTCHNKFDTPIPIGPKPQNLNRLNIYDNNLQNQLQKLIEFGYLESNMPNEINTMVEWSDPLADLNLRVRSYLDINCAHCHSDESYCEYRSMRFAFNQNDLYENIGICVEPETAFIPNSKIVTPDSKELSILHYRINTTEQSLRMPLFGRTLKHEEGVRLVEEWITSLNIDCQ